MSGDLLQQQVALETRLREATVENRAVTSSLYATPAERAVKAKAFADAAAELRAVKDRVAAATPNPVHAPVTNETAGAVLADVQDADIRAGAARASQAYEIPATVIRMALDDVSRAKHMGGDPQAEALRVINGALGKDAPAALAAAKALVARDPKLADFLADSGMGNSPWMIRHLAGVARKRGIGR